MGYGMQLVIEDEPIAEICGRLSEGRPRSFGAGEPCGVLGGHTIQDSIRVTCYLPAPSCNMPSRFSIPARTMGRLSEALSVEHGCRLVAIHHHHPSGRLTLSPEDRAHLERSTLPWVITAFSDDGLHVAAYSVRGTELVVSSDPALCDPGAR
jgi:proteasome lid subunit RPN8/RPN11